MAIKIPSLILKQLYTFGSLKNVNGGVQFSVKNRLSDATLTGLNSIKFDGQAIPLDGVTIILEDGATLTVDEITAVYHPQPLVVKFNAQMFVGKVTPEF